MSDDTLRNAARALLAGQFVTGSDAVTIRRQQRKLAELFRNECGWQVLADDNGPVRALCLPGPGHIARGLKTRSGRPFDSARYTLLFLVLATLEAVGARTTLQDLFAGVRERVTGIEGFDFDDQRAANRRAFVHAVHAAVDMGVLELAEGGEEAFAAQGVGDALYRVDRSRIAALLATSKPPSLAADAEAATAENRYTSTDDGRLRRLRHRVMRALLCEPVVYRSDLDEDEIDYLTRTESAIEKRLLESFGLALETRAQGWVAVDTLATVDGAGRLSDLAFPDITPARATALAIVDASRARRNGADIITWAADELTDFVGGLAERFGTSWTLELDDEDGIARRTHDAVAVLVDMRLATASPDGSVTVLPAAGRFSLTPTAPTATSIFTESPS
jgi:uncharacterized protein (TIGR02678 family)